MGFLSDLSLGRYYPTGSPIHALDPRVKMVGVLALLVTVLLTESPVAYVFLSITLGLLVASSSLPAGLLLRNLGSLRWLLVIVLIMHGFFTDGMAVFAWLPALTWEGLGLGAIFAWRIGLMVSAATLLTATTSPVDLGDGVEKLGKPFARLGVPIHELAMISVIALRFVPTLLDEARRIIKAQIGRGATFEGGPVARAKSAVPILIPLFASAFRRADDLALAMDARCYRGAVGRTKYVELTLDGRDYCGFAVIGLIVVVTLVLPRLV
jgi:energy-coupling factor transport system permease protein